MNKIAIVALSVLFAVAFLAGGLFLVQILSGHYDALSPAARKMASPILICLAGVMVGLRLWISRRARARRK